MYRYLTQLLFTGVIAVALSVVVAEPAYANHCKGKHKNDPGCEGAGATLGDLSCTTDQIAKYDGT